MKDDLLWRFLAPAAAIVAVALGAPPQVAVALSVLALGLAVERLVALRRPHGLGRLVVWLGVMAVALGATAIVFRLSPVGLSALNWSASVTLLSVLGLLAANTVPPRPVPEGEQTRSGRGAGLRAAPWAAAAVTAVVVSVTALGGPPTLSAPNGATGTELAAPPEDAATSRAPGASVRMSFGRIRGTSVAVVVTSTEAIGPLEIRTSSDGNDVSYPLISVPENGSVTTTVALPSTGRYVVTLIRPGRLKPLRRLFLDR